MPCWACNDEGYVLAIGNYPIAVPVSIGLPRARRFRAANAWERMRMFDEVGLQLQDCVHFIDRLSDMLVAEPHAILCPACTEEPSYDPR